MNPQSPTHPNDNPNLTNEGQPISTNITPHLNRSDNFIDTTEDGLFDFDLEDLENLFNTNTASPAQSPASTPHIEPTSQPLPALDLSKASLEAQGVQLPENPSSPTQTNTAIHFEKSSEMPLSDETPSPEITPAPAPIDETKSPAPSEPVTLIKNAPINPSAGGEGNHHPPPPTTIVAKRPNKSNKPLLILLGLLGVGALAWLASQFLSEPEPTPAPQSTQAPKAVSAAAGLTPASAAGTVTTSTPTAAVSSPVAMASVSTTASSPLATKIIKPEEILATPLPKDNAIAKEEIDRLADQSKQLSQQEKMMEEQLKMMNELSSKKEERIALLEKQIAQIEAQKGQAKK